MVTGQFWARFTFSSVESILNYFNFQVQIESGSDSRFLSRGLLVRSLFE